MWSVRKGEGHGENWLYLFLSPTASIKFWKFQHRARNEYEAAWPLLALVMPFNLMRLSSRDD